MRPVVVFSGGSSLGGRDLIQDVIGRRGRLLLHGTASALRRDRETDGRE